jgi:RecB family exonuclease
MEAWFAGLRVGDCPFDLRGRIDRLDCHADTGDLIVWDYKSGEIPKTPQVFDDLEEYQLPCYLLAVLQGLVPGTRPTAGLQAGFIGLKSSRETHLKYEDFEKRAAEWPRVLAEFAARLAALGRRLAAGDFRPEPFPAPAGNKPGACRYCSYGLVCGFIRETPREEGEEGE